MSSMNSFAQDNNIIIIQQELIGDVKSNNIQGVRPIDYVTLYTESTAHVRLGSPTGYLELAGVVIDGDDITADTINVNTIDSPNINTQIIHAISTTFPVSLFNNTLMPITIGGVIIEGDTITGNLTGLIITTSFQSPLPEDTVNLFTNDPIDSRIINIGAYSPTGDFITTLNLGGLFIAGNSLQSRSNTLALGNLDTLVTLGSSQISSGIVQVGNSVNINKIGSLQVSGSVINSSAVGTSINIGDNLTTGSIFLGTNQLSTANVTLGNTININKIGNLKIVGRDISPVIANETMIIGSTFTNGQIQIGNNMNGAGIIYIGSHTSKVHLSKLNIQGTQINSDATNNTMEFGSQLTNGIINLGTAMNSTGVINIGSQLGDINLGALLINNNSISTASTGANLNLGINISTGNIYIGSFLNAISTVFLGNNTCNINVGKINFQEDEINTDATGNLKIGNLIASSSTLTIGNATSQNIIGSLKVVGSVMNNSTVAGSIAVGSDMTATSELFLGTNSNINYLGKLKVVGSVMNNSTVAGSIAVGSDMTATSELFLGTNSNINYLGKLKVVGSSVINKVATENMYLNGNSDLLNKVATGNLYIGSGTQADKYIFINNTLSETVIGGISIKDNKINPSLGGANLLIGDTVTGIASVKIGVSGKNEIGGIKITGKNLEATDSGNITITKPLISSYAPTVLTDNNIGAYKEGSTTEVVTSSGVSVNIGTITVPAGVWTIYGQATAYLQSSAGYFTLSITINNTSIDPYSKVRTETNTQFSVTQQINRVVWPTTTTTYYMNTQTGVGTTVGELNFIAVRNG